jgi:hypothetical protein
MEFHQSLIRSLQKLQKYISKGFPLHRNKSSDIDTEGSSYLEFPLKIKFTDLPNGEFCDKRSPTNTSSGENAGDAI